MRSAACPAPRTFSADCYLRQLVERFEHAAAGSRSQPGAPRGSGPRAVAPGATPSSAGGSGRRRSETGDADRRPARAESRPGSSSMCPSIADTSSSGSVPPRSAARDHRRRRSCLDRRTPLHDQARRLQATSRSHRGFPPGADQVTRITARASGRRGHHHQVDAGQAFGPQADDVFGGGLQLHRVAAVHLGHSGIRSRSLMSISSPSSANTVSGTATGALTNNTYSPAAGRGEGDVAGGAGPAGSPPGTACRRWRSPGRRC